MEEKVVTEVVKLRKLILQKGSFYINVPREFIKRRGLKAGDRLPLVVSNNSVKIVPFERENGS